MTPIKNYDTYTNLLKNSLYDKLFFTDKLFEDWNTLVDFGCADGFLTKAIASLFPNKTIIGYDNDKTMIERAYSYNTLPSNVSFTSNIEDVRKADVILLSSIIHEIYSYTSPEDVEEFWKLVFNKTRKYVIIRDMAFNYNGQSIWVNTQEAKIVKYCLEMGITDKLHNFEKLYGSISRPESMVHWLIKYLYVNSPNWERELNENYLALNNHTLSHKGKVPENFEIFYKEFYILPYLKYRWSRDIELDGEFPMPTNTHCKFIFKNKSL